VTSSARPPVVSPAQWQAARDELLDARDTSFVLVSPAPFACGWTSTSWT